MSEEQENSTGTGTENEGAAELTPEQLKKALEQTRKESASYRTKLRDAETKLSTAKSVEDFEAARTELTEANKKLARELLVERVGRGLPDDLRSALKGETEAELKAHAEVLKKYAPAAVAPPEKLGGGLNAGSGGGDDWDVQKIARLARLGRL